jgi:hypothetical protein
LTFVQEERDKGRERTCRGTPKIKERGNERKRESEKEREMKKRERQTDTEKKERKGEDILRREKERETS